MNQLIKNDIIKLRSLNSVQKVGVFGSVLGSSNPNDVDIFIQSYDAKKVECDISDLNLNFPTIKVERNMYNKSDAEQFGYHLVLSDSEEFSERIERLNEVCFE